MKITSHILYPISLKTMDGCSILDWGDIQYYRYENGDNFWFKDEKLHCLTGPAKIWNYGQDKQWWINGEQINCNSQEEFERIVKLKVFL